MKSRPSKLDQFTDKLDQWFGQEKLTLDQVQQKLAAEGFTASRSGLSHWWQQRHLRVTLEEDRRMALTRIALGAETNKKIKSQFAKTPAPELPQIMSVVSALVMELSLKGTAQPQMLKMAKELLDPVVKVEQLRVKNRELELNISRWQRETCELFIKWAADERARQIAASGSSHSEKIEALGKAMFGPDWKDSA